VQLVNANVFTNVIVPRDWDSQGSPVQPSSIDLHAGFIYIPGKGKHKKGGVDNPVNEIVLRPGETVLVETSESLALGADLAAFGFPPTSISNKAVLMTSPGHVDPGYKGRLHFTLINMGRQDFLLRAGDRIVTLLVVRLSAGSRAPYDARVGSPPAGNQHLQDELESLAHDFLQVTERANRAASAAARRANLFLPIITALIGVLVTVVTAYLLPWRDATHALESKVAALEARADTHDLESRIGQLEAWRSSQKR